MSQRGRKANHKTPGGDPLVIDLWPTAGGMIGLGRNQTYQAAHAGEIPGLLRFGRRFKVSYAPFKRMLETGEQPGRNGGGK